MKKFLNIQYDSRFGADVNQIINIDNICFVSFMGDETKVRFICGEIRVYRQSDCASNYDIADEIAKALEDMYVN